MTKAKYIIFAILILTILLLMPNIANAAEDTYTSSSTINGQEVKWEYTIIEDNKIKNLKCKNPSEISGSIAIPSTIDGKEVSIIGMAAFREASNLKEIIIPSTVVEIGSSAFAKCTSLEKINLGNVQKLGNSAFVNCSSLKSITIPKTLKSTYGVYSIFEGCINLTEVTLEEGLTIIPANLFSNTNIKEITVPNSVKEIEYDAFEKCTSLEKVNLGSVQELGNNAFKDCSALKSITIPKTLKSTYGLYPIFEGCTNLTEVTLEEGLTTIPSHLLDNTNIKEIIVPNSVKEIDYDAFSSCKDLTKITILDNVTQIHDNAFENHNEDLTIYCYEGSVAAQYAIDHNIKYVYLERDNNVAGDEDNTGTQTNNSNISNGNLNNLSTSNKGNDTTTAKGTIPQTGIGIGLICFITVITVVGVTLYIKYNKLKDVK